MRYFILSLLFSTAVMAAPLVSQKDCIKKNNQGCIKAMCHLPAQPACLGQCKAMAKDKCKKIANQLKFSGE